MAFDPTKPVAGAEIDAVELNSQFNGLNDLITDLPTMANVNDAIVSNTAGPVGPLLPPNFTVSNPPTQAEVQAIATYVTNLYVALARL